MNNRFDFLEKALSKQRSQGRLRTLKTFTRSDRGLVRDAEDITYIDLSGNDYLGLSSHPEIVNSAVEAVHEYGTGSTASRLITGTTPAHETLEQELAEWLNREATLVFNSGYQMNTTLIAALCDKNTNLFFDKLNHNSLLQGALLGRGKLHRYRHADSYHLDELLKRYTSANSRSVIVTESVFSMDGDVPDLDQIASLADKYNAILIVDEAHSIGLWGKQGKGFTYDMKRVDIVLGTFGKSFGSFGAFAACSEKMRHYLINFCGGFIYTTALPASTIAATTAALRLMPGLDHIRNKVITNSAWFRELLTERGFNLSGSASQIIPVVIGSEVAAMNISNQLKNEGYLAVAIRPPTVAAGTSRLRFTISALVDREHLLAVNAILQQNVPV